MITFKPKKYKERDLIPEAIHFLESSGRPFSEISKKEADDVSKINSRSMVLCEFMQTSDGKFKIVVQEKEGYRYTAKLLGNCGLKVLESDPKTRKTTAQIDYLGKALGAIEILSLHYNLSIVV
jgi:hypothetical protein